LIAAVFAVELGFGCFGIAAFFAGFKTGTSVSFGPLYLRVIFFMPAVRLSTFDAGGCDGKVSTGAELETRRLLRRSGKAPLILRDFLTATEGWSEVGGSLTVAIFAALTAAMPRVA